MYTRFHARYGTFAPCAWLFLVTTLGACRHDPATKPASHASPTATTPVAPAAEAETDWRSRGASAGRISPRLASCPGHCRHELDQLQPHPASDQANAFAQACLGSCLTQVFEEKGVQCYAVFGAASASDWQALYLMRGLAEAMIPCAAQVSDAGPDALRMRTLFESEQRSAETLAAVAAERRALVSGSPDDMQSAVAARRHANESQAWRAVLEAFQGWQASPPQGEGLLECFERQQAICAAALGAE